MKVRLGNFLKLVKRGVEVHADVTYRQIGVRVWGKGSYERETITGKDTQYKILFEVKSGDLIINKIWTRNGAIAIVPVEHDGCFVSTEFPTFVIDFEKVHPDWLNLKLASQDFWHECGMASGGTSGKNRIKVEKFLNIEIELPGMQRQQTIVKKLKLLIEEELLIQEMIDMNRKILNQILSSLFTLKTNEVETMPLENYLLDISYGLSVSAKQAELSSDVRLLRITDIQNNSVNWEQVPTFSAQQSVRNNQLLSKGDIVIARTGGTVGKSFFINALPYQAVYASYLIRLRVDKNKLYPEFLSLFLQSDLYWKQVNAKKRGTGQPNVNAKVLKSINIPVPTIEQQEKLIQEFDFLAKKNNSLFSLLTKQSNIASKVLLQSSKKEEL